MSKEKNKQDKKTAPKKEEDVKEKKIEEETKRADPTSEEKEDEWKSKYVRMLADFENYKKRTQKEMTGSFNNGVSMAAEQLLPVLDNLERAISSIEEGDNSNFAEGVKMVHKQLVESFEKIGIKPINALGEKFDPNFHNAVMHIDDNNFGEGEITEEFMKGYTLGDKVIRHSMVKVAN